MTNNKLHVRAPPNTNGLETTYPIDRRGTAGTIGTVAA